MSETTCYTFFSFQIRILLLVTLFCNGQLLGQTKDTIYTNGDTVTFGKDTGNKKHLLTIIYSKPISRSVEGGQSNKATDWTKVSALTQIVGTVLVIVTFIFLYFQIKIATRNNQLNTFQHVRDTINGFSDLIAQSADLTEILIEGRKSYTGLPPVEKIRFERIHARLFNLLETWHTLIDEMVLSKKFKRAQVKNINEAIKSFFRYKGVMEFWESYKNLYTSELDDLIKRCEIKFEDSINTISSPEEKEGSGE